MAKKTTNAALDIAAMLGARGAKVCPLAHPCRVCGKEETAASTTVHLNGKHSLSSCYDCGRKIDRAIRDKRITLAELLAADDMNFSHDVFGIMRHIDRETGKLGGCFLPRYAKLEAKS